MAKIERSAVELAVAAIADPHRGQDLLSSGALESVTVDGDQVSVALKLSYPANGLKDALIEQVTTKVEQLDGVAKASVSLDWEIAAAPVQGELQNITDVRNIIAVASGKGGVGKSTTAVNLALALAAEGARVGILDADIHGPSIGLMLGVESGLRPDVIDEKIMLPITALGLQAMSMAFLVDENQPMVWRGPMVSGALQQLLTQTRWQNLDYLIVDMPPGTGDIQLTLAQSVPVAGAVIVTTPQDLALLDAKKGVEMFRQVHVPVLGVVENMAVHICSNCGHSEHLFGAGGGERLAKAYDVEVLGSLPLSMEIREQADSGLPTVASAPDSELAQSYRNMAREMAAALAKRCEQGSDAPTISICDD